MSQNKNAAILFGLCSALAGCDRAPTSDLTEPEAVTSDAAVAAAESMNLLAARNTWATKRSLSPWRRDAAAGTINGIIYVVGGQSRTSALKRMDAYNVATNTWSAAPSVPSTINWGGGTPNGASVINGKLYVTGGHSRDFRATRILLVYNPAARSWSRKADMPRVGCGGGEQGVIGGQLYVYTGCYAAKNMGRVFFRYNPATNTWVTRAAPPVDHYLGAGAVVNGKLYLAGGYKLVKASPTNSEYEEKNGQLDVYNPATNTWTTKAPMPLIREGMAAAMLNGKLFFAGGVSWEEPDAELHVYDPMTNRWTQKAPMPTQHTHGAAAAAGGRLFFIAGVEWLQPPGPSKVYGYTP